MNGIVRSDVPEGVVDKLKYGECYKAETTAGFVRIVRVPGGYIYERFEKYNVRGSLAVTFVPYN